MSRITAFLGLDATAFQAGLDKANVAARNFRQQMAQAGGGQLASAVGVAALVKGFGAILTRAQEARDAAGKLNRTVDDGTNSVAKLADAWDRIKGKIADAGVGFLSLFTRTGEGLGEDFNDFAMSRLRGMTPEQAKRTREISEKADANADRLSSPEAMEAAKKRGDDRKVAAARADEQNMKTVAGLMNEASESREKAALEALPIEQQITELERRKLSFQKDYANTANSSLTRAKALNQLAKTEEEIVRKKAQQEREITDEKRKQADITKAYNAKAKELLEAGKREADAQGRVDSARRNLSTQISDSLGFTLSDAASGQRGSPSDNMLAQRIQQDEATARRLHDSGNSVAMWDEKTQKPFKADAGFFHQRAQTARENFNGLVSGEKNPFAGAETELKAAGVDLKAAAADLKNISLEVTVD